MTTDTRSLVRVPSHIGGADADNGRTLTLLNPYTEQPWASLTDADTSIIDTAFSGAATGLGGWQDLGGDGRARLMNALADALVARTDELARLESGDNGKPIRETRAQVGFAARNLRYFAGLADKVFGTVVPMDKPNLLDYYTREPHGICTLVVAWNSPLQLAVNKIAPALACGNVVVIKPSELACASVVELARIATRVGFPPGVISVVTGGPDVGRAVVAHPATRMVSLTGGVATGRKVAQAASERLVPLVLELGGKSPQIVFADAALDKAVVGVLAGIFGAAGQTCMAGSRLYVQDAVYDAFLARLAGAATQIRIGDPVDPATEMGPLISAPHREHVLSFVREAVAEGASLVIGGGKADDGSGHGYFVAPTILTNVSPDMRCVREEVFGPVLAVTPFRTEEEVVTLANDTVYGLAAGIWTDSVSRATRLTRAITAGTVWVNTYRAVSAGGPFGGFGLSGYGRERSVEAIREYTRTKNVVIDMAADSANRDPFVIGV